MIQRIQSLYMVLAVVVLALAYVFPQISTQPELYTLADLTGALFPVGMLIGIIAANIFNFKKRKQQFVIGRLAIILTFLTFGYIIYGYFTVGGEMPGYAMAAPLITVILLSMANKAIQKDEELVQSSNRFR